MNVSEAGLLLRSATRVAPGSLAQVETELPGGGEADRGGGASRPDPAGRGTGYEIATRIEHMSTLHQRRFNVFLRDLKSGSVVQIRAESAARGGGGSRPGGARTAKTA